MERTPRNASKKGVCDQARQVDGVRIATLVCLFSRRFVSFMLFYDKYEG